jgi:hypothetical protein
MAPYNELTFTAITVEDFRQSTRLPAGCDICNRGEELFMRYELHPLQLVLKRERKRTGFAARSASQAWCSGSSKNRSGI